jgi:hypothetical protein
LDNPVTRGDRFLGPGHHGVTASAAARIHLTIITSKC